MRRITVVPLILFMLALPLSAKEMTILVQPFENTGDAAYSWISAGMTASVISDLGKIRDVTVISDAERRKAAEEIQLGLSGMVDEQKAVKVGNLLGANLIFSGSYQVSGTQVRVNASLTDVAKGSVERSVKVDGTLGGIFALQDQIVFALMAETEKIKIADVKPVKFTAEEKKQIESAEKPSLSAYELYSKGLQARTKDPRASLDFFKQAVKAQPDYAAALVEAGYTAGSILNLFAEGLGYIEKADALYAKRGETNTGAYAGVMMIMGNVHKEMGQLDRALEYMDKSKRIRDALGQQNTDGYAALLTNTGIIYDKMKKNDRALECYAQARAIYDTLGKQKSNSYSVLLMNIGVIYAESKQPDKALEYYTQSMQIKEALGLQKTKGYAILLMDIGNIYLRKDELDKVEIYYTRSLEIRDAMGLQETITYATLLSNFGKLCEKQGKKDLAGQYYRRAYETYAKTGYKGPLTDKALKNAERLGK
jgi:tetratricopeptide (TPR) repeat protein/TolB-like protein